MADTNRPRDTENLARSQNTSGISATNATQRQIRPINPDLEDQYWRERFSTRPYVKADRGYEFYRPAYQMGWEASGHYAGSKQWHEVEPELRRNWEQRYHSTASKAEGTGQRAKNVSVGIWDDIKDAVKEGWEHAIHP